jgi:hypothetical protein
MKHAHSSVIKLTELIEQHVQLAGGSRKMSVQIASEIAKWVVNNGEAYATERLKQLKLTLIHFWAGDSDYLSYAPWFKRSADRKGLYGPFRHLFKKSPSKRELRYALSVANIYYTFVMVDTDTQEEEMIENITKPYDGVEITDSKSLTINEWSGCKSPDMTVRPSFVGLTTSKPEGFGALRAPGASKDHPWLSSLVRTSMMTFPHDSLLDTSLIKKEPLRPFEGPVGDLAFLKERGMKLRMICVPEAEVQVVLMPLHRSLQRFLNRFNEDCTLDQTKGAKWALKKLQQGSTLHSVDLKSATDRFPRKLQYQLAISAGLDPIWVQVFESLVRYGFNVRNKHVHYSVGQPMGFAGSFPFLAIGQHGLIRLAATNLGISAKNQYVVLGDDVILSNDDLHQEYRRLLGLYSIPISEHKCVSSDKLAEFAGFVIDPYGYHKGTKLKRGVESRGKLNLDTMVSYAQTQGKIPAPLKKVRELVPLVYGLEEHGGLGLNPLGLTKSERALWYDDIKDTSIDLTPKSVTKFEELRRYLISTLYGIDSGEGEKPLNIHFMYREAVHFVLKNYLDELEDQLNAKLSETQFSFLKPLPGVFQHAALEDSSFLIGMSPYMEAMPATRSWVRKKYPYFFLQEEEVQSLIV